MSVWVTLEGVQVVDIVCKTRKKGWIVKDVKHEHEEEGCGVDGGGEGEA